MPLGAGAATLLVATGTLLALALRITGGTLVYALDDAYIHVAVARRLAEDGVWGVSRDGFAGVSSSLLWPLVLAAARTAGLPPDLAPLLGNLGAAVLCVLLAARMIGEPTRAAALVVSGLVLVTPLPTLVLAGMEHALHVAAVLWLLAALRSVLGGRGRGGPAMLGLAALACTALRYESVFLLAPAAVALAHRRRWRDVAVVAAGSAAPVAAYALLAMRHGWPPLPMPLLLKGAMPLQPGVASALDLAGGRAARTLLAVPELLVVLAVLCAGAALVRGRDVERVLAVVVAAAIVLHAQLAGTGWLYRYEAYLVAAGVVAAAMLLVPGPSAAAWNLPSERGRRALALAALLLAALPLGARAAGALRDAPGAVRDIHRQQYQMGLFAARHYPGATVMANDIGALAALGDLRLVDLYGLATLETAEARREGALDRAFLERLTARAAPDFIVVYRSWFGSSIPPGWIEVGSWRAPPVVVSADRTVTFYAPDEARARRLAGALAQFAPLLPADVAAR